MALPKLFQRIFWHNNTTPAINEDNLNAMSKAIDDIDDRVIELGDDVIEVVPIIVEGLQDLDEAVETAQTAATTATTKAGEASTSATNAANSATSAGTSATTATTKAGEASTSATTASTKAGEASASATTASTKAGEAATSATNAANSATAAAASASQAAAWSANPPYIGANGNWYVYDTTTSAYVDSGVDASITVDIADVTALAPDANPYVTNTGTSTDPVFHLFIPRGATGTDGVSPIVTITTITGGHRVTIIDEDHPTGQSFDVMDGSGSGDMRAAVYDPNGIVASAGGIEDYVAAHGGDVLPFVTPEQFGAKGDGTTDDTAAFTAAFAACRYVKCMPNKTYNFTGTVDASAISMGIFDINNSNLKGFHIKICMANDYQPTVGYPRPMFIIRNGRLNYQVDGKPTNWDIPVIISGARMLIENIHCWNTPYLMAVTNSFRDALTIRNISNYMDMSTSRWDGTTFDLDAISLIKSDGSFVRINNNDIKTSVTPSVAGGFGGDAWLFEQINEYRGIQGSDYAFIHFNTNTALRITNCIQTKFVIGQYCQAVFESCHFEDEYTLPEIYNLSDATTHTTTWNDKLVTFRNCCFWDKYAFETNKRYVEYYDCYIRGGSSAQDPTIPLATLFNNVDLYDMKCKMYALHVGQTSIVDTEELNLYKKLPKRTRNSNNNTSNEQTLAGKISATKTLASGTNTYPATGTYTYVGYAFTNGYMDSSGDKIAHEKYQWTRVVNNLKSENDNAQIRGLSGGWSFEIYRTLPDGTTIQRARFYSDPFDRNVTEQMYFNINNKGNYLEIRSGYGATSNYEISYAIPWITVASIPNYTVNAQVYEKNGVLVTLDDSVISSLSNKAFAQVKDAFSVPSWPTLSGKPFSSIGSGLTVSSDTLAADVQSVTVGLSGIGTSISPRYQRVSVNGDSNEINGTKYIETTTYTTSGNNRVFTFTNVSQDAVIDGPYCDKIGVAPTAQTHSGTTYTVSFATSDAVGKVRIYLK